MRKSSVNDDNSAKATKVVGGHDTMNEWNKSSSLPIADQFMQSPQRSPFLAGVDERVRSVSPPILRKPVPTKAKADKTNIDPSKDSGYENAGPGVKDSVVDDLSEDVSHVRLTSSRFESGHEKSIHPPLETGSGSNNINGSIPQRSSLDKPLPSLPNTEPGPGGFDGSHNGVEAINSTRRRNLEKELGVEGQLDLGNTEDTDIHTHWEPSVTHEVIREDVHEVQQQLISRDIHQGHIYHRILPVEEVEVLPARHYVRGRTGELQEITDQRPDRQMDKYIQKGIAKGLEKALPHNKPSAGGMTFSAREFPDDEGDYREVVKSDGSVNTERWWIHAPTLERDGIKSGQTTPLHFGSKNRQDDGWRTWSCAQKTP